MVNLLSEAYLKLDENDFIELGRIADAWIAAEKANQNLYYQYAHGW